MKKIIFLIMMLALSMTVFAQTPEGIEEVDDIFGNRFVFEKSIQVREQAMERLQSEEAVQSLNQSIIRFREQNRETYEITEIKRVGLEINGDTPAFEVKAQRQGRLFNLIPVNVSEDLTVNEDTGEILARRIRLWHYFVNYENQ